MNIHQIISIILLILTLGSFALLPFEFAWGPAQKMNPVMIVISHIISTIVTGAGIIVGLLGIVNGIIVIFVKSKQKLDWYSTVAYVFSWIFLILGQIFSCLLNLLFVPLPELPISTPENILVYSPWILLGAKIVGGVVGGVSIAIFDSLVLIFPTILLILFSKGEKKTIKK